MENILVVREEEMTCVINILHSTYNRLLPLFEESISYTKTCYPSNIRLLTYETSSLLQRKTCLSKKIIQTEMAGFLLSIDHTIATETPIKSFAELQTLPILYTVYRRVFLDIFRVRFAIDFLPHINLYRFCFEYEKDNLTIDEFIDVINRESVISMLEIVFQQPISIGKILQSNYTVARPFFYQAPIGERPIYYAQKLDGIKYACIIRPNEIVIPMINNQLHFKTNLKQTMYGCVEVIDRDVYLIDINYVLCENGLYFEVGHLIACGILRNLEIISKAVNVHVNKFVCELDKLTEAKHENSAREIYDGYLVFYYTAIVKHKKIITVDLMLSCTRKYEKKSDIEKSLQFAGGETIKEHGYHIEDFPLDILARKRNRQFFILEFICDKNKKILKFLRIRNDKGVANRLAVFMSMISSQ